MRRRRRHAQPGRPFGDRRGTDGLNVNAFRTEPICDGQGGPGVSDDEWNDGTVPSRGEPHTREAAAKPRSVLVKTSTASLVLHDDP